MAKIHLQPREICVPEDDPFKHDLLGRKVSVEVLTHLVNSLEGPCVLAVDAAWGNGKTTFLRIWEQYLRNKGFPVVRFNAWETDFSEDPFVALSTELTSGLQEHADPSIAAKVAAMKKSAGKVLLRAVPGVIRLATGGIVDIGPLEELGNALASYAEERISAYQGARESVEEFRSRLQDMAATVSESSDGRPLVVMIDELDRCRPSYAVELLEVAKHLFSVAGIVFVLAVNRDQLAHSIKALYGSEFDAQGYLRRFFDADIRLPEPKREAFIAAMLAAIQIDDYFSGKGAGHIDVGAIRSLLQGFFRSPDLDLRRIAQAIQRLGLVFASLDRDQQALAIPTTVALILRTIDPDLYHRFIRGAASDLDVVDRVFKLSRVESLRQQSIGRRFEAEIIVAAQDRDRRVRGTDLQSPGPVTPLMKRYQDLASSTPARPDDPAWNHAHTVLEMVEAFNRERRRYDPDQFKFGSAVYRIELLSPALIDRT